jgi:hypothetical protein
MYEFWRKRLRIGQGLNLCTTVGAAQRVAMVVLMLTAVLMQPLCHARPRQYLD